MNDCDAPQSTEPPGKADGLVTVRDRAVGDNAGGPQQSGSQDHRDDGDGSSRHDSPSFQLILSERVLRRFELLCQPQRVPAWTALVLVNSQGERHSFLPEQRPTMGELLWKGRGTLYEVNMGLHRTRLKLDLPSHAEAFPFHAVVNVEWRVDDPAKVVENGVNDVREAFFPALHQQLSTITRQFDVENTPAAEAKALESLIEHPVGGKYGLLSSVALRMQMDEPTVTHAAEIRQVQREIRLEHKTQMLRLLREELTTTLMTKRVERYRNIIITGDYDQFALQLAQNPHEVGTVIQMLRDQRHDNLRNTTDFVTRLIDSGAIDRYEINDQVRAALDWFKEATDTVLWGPEQPARIPAKCDFDALPPTEIPEPGLPDTPPANPVQPPGGEPTHGAGKP